MILTKTIPQRTKSFEILWCKQEFMNYGKLFSHRQKAKMKTQAKCFWCGCKFEHTETVSLVGVKGSKNQLVCQPCATTFQIAKARE